MSTQKSNRKRLKCKDLKKTYKHRKMLKQHQNKILRKLKMISLFLIKMFKNLRLNLKLNRIVKVISKH